MNGNAPLSGQHVGPLNTSHFVFHVDYSEIHLLRHSMEPKNNVALGGCRIMECLLPYFNMVIVPPLHSDITRRNVGLQRCRIKEVPMFFHTCLLHISK